MHSVPASRALLCRAPRLQLPAAVRLSAGLWEEPPWRVPRLLRAALPLLPAGRGAQHRAVGRHCHPGQEPSILPASVFCGTRR